jgi:Holliday junction resolvasome RuvABC DNA-binding subunit
MSKVPFDPFESPESIKDPKLDAWIAMGYSPSQAKQVKDSVAKAYAEHCRPGHPVSY